VIFFERFILKLSFSNNDTNFFQISISIIHKSADIFLPETTSKESIHHDKTAYSNGFSLSKSETNQYIV